MEVSGQLHAPAAGRLTPSERAPSTHWVGGWVGPRAFLDSKNAWSYTSTPQYAFMVWCSVKKTQGHLHLRHNIKIHNKSCHNVAELKYLVTKVINEGVKKRLNSLPKSSILPSHVWKPEGQNAKKSATLRVYSCRIWSLTLRKEIRWMCMVMGWERWGTHTKFKLGNLHGRDHLLGGV
jgi:hypothetical protein